MSQISCQQLREKLQNIKELKEQFDLLLKSATDLNHISELKGPCEFLKLEIETFKLKFFESPKLVKKLKEHYFSQINTLENLKICSRTNPFITDINDKKHKIPSFKQILAGLTLETIKKISKFKKPQLLLTPIGMSVQTFSEKVDEYESTIDIDTNISSFFWDKTPRIYEDKLYYFPKNSKNKNHKGQTKSEVIKARGGWILSVVDLEPQEKNFLKLEPEEEFEQMLQAKLQLGLRGMTCEEYLMLAIEMQKQSYPLDQNSRTILDGMIDEISERENKYKVTGCFKPNIGPNLDFIDLEIAKNVNLNLIHRCVVDIII